MKLKIIHTAHHRNGVHGASFDLVLFEDRGLERSRKVGILFEQPHHCAVLDVDKLAQGDIAFGSNSWRGDEYERDLRNAIDSESLTATAESLPEASTALYHVHIYREMRLYFPGIEARSPDDAARIAADKPPADAEYSEDCGGENLAALIDVAGDDDFTQSAIIDFEPERLRKAAPRLLAALAAILPYAENENQSLYECWNRDGDAAMKDEVDACRRAIEQAQAAVTAATSECPQHVSDSPDIDTILASRRQVAVVWSIDDVQAIRPELTDEQAWEVLQAADRHHDAVIGINWDVLGCYADILFSNTSQTDEVPEVQP
jgi:hypothetical protein